jgi:hypothetical protein
VAWAVRVAILLPRVQATPQTAPLVRGLNRIWMVQVPFGASGRAGAIGGHDAEVHGIDALDGHADRAAHHDARLRTVKLRVELWLVFPVVTVTLPKL